METLTKPILLITTFTAAIATASANAAIVIDNSGAIAGRTCSVTEVQLGGSTADYCAGYFDLGNAGDAAELSKLNAVTDGTDWSYLFKTPSTDKGDFGGLDFGVSYDGGGNWTISWSDDNGDAPLNLPAYLDIAVLFKAGSSNGNSGGGWAYFLFDDELLTASPTSRSGTYVLSVRPGLSHMGLFVRSGTTPTEPPNPPSNVPVPGTITLLGVGLLGLARRFSRSRSA